MTELRIRRNKVELSTIVTLYKTKVSTKMVNGEKVRSEEQVLDKELPVTKWIDRDGISMVDDFITEKNTIDPNRSLIFDKYSNRFYATFHSVDDVMDSLDNKQKIGF